MKKIVLVSTVVLISATSLWSISCRCAASSKDLARCEYYVKEKFDLTHQKNCLDYADATIDALPAKAAWYYILGGNTKKAKESIEKALKLNQYFALEYLAIVLAIEKDYQNARKVFEEFKKKVKKHTFVKKDLETVKKIYKNFDTSSFEF